MVTAPTLFDQLRVQEHRLGLTDRHRLCQMERDWLDQTNDIGILADLSTVEFACRTLAILWREHKTQGLLSQRKHYILTMSYPMTPVTTKNHG